MAHAMKMTRAVCGHMFKHYERAKDSEGNYIKFGNQDIDTEKSHLNYNLASQKDQGEFVRKRCSEVKCLNRKDVNVMCSWVVTAPKDLPEGEQKLFFKSTYEFLSQRYGEQNVVSAFVHMDENQPHLHFSFVPVITDKKKMIEKVSAKDCIDRKELKKFHGELENHLKKELGHEVNILNGSTKDGNRSISQLKQDTRRLLSELDKMPQIDVKKAFLNKGYVLVHENDLNALNDGRKALRLSLNKLDMATNELNQELEEVHSDKKLYKFLCEKQKNLQADYDVLEQKLKSYEQMQSKLQQYQNMEKEIEELKSSLEQEKNKRMTAEIKLSHSDKKTDSLSAELEKLNKMHEKDQVVIEMIEPALQHIKKIKEFQEKVDWDSPYFSENLGINASIEYYQEEILRALRLEKIPESSTKEKDWDLIL